MAPKEDGSGYETTEGNEGEGESGPVNTEQKPNDVITESESGKRSGEHVR